MLLGLLPAHHEKDQPDLGRQLQLPGRAGRQPRPGRLRRHLLDRGRDRQDQDLFAKQRTKLGRHCGKNAEPNPGAMQKVLLHQQKEAGLGQNCLGIQEGMPDTSKFPISFAKKLFSG